MELPDSEAKPDVRAGNTRAGAVAVAILTTARGTATTEATDSGTASAAEVSGAGAITPQERSDEALKTYPRFIDSATFARQIDRSTNKIHRPVQFC
jgi:hypothetical protein